MERRIEFIEDEAYPFRIEEWTDGWPGSGFEHKTVEMKARVFEGEAQFEISITEVKPSGRMYHTVTSVVLPSQMREALVEALTGAGSNPSHPAHPDPTEVLNAKW